MISLRPSRRSGTSARVLLVRAADDRGNTLVEFVVLAVVLLIPTLYLVLTLGSVQGAVFAGDVIARDAARIHATQTDEQTASARSRAHADMVLEDFGLATQDVLTISCTEDPCASPGSLVTATVRVAVPVPGLGPVLGGQGPVVISAQHTAPADQHRQLPEQTP